MRNHLVETRKRLAFYDHLGEMPEPNSITKEAAQIFVGGFHCRSVHVEEAFYSKADTFEVTVSVKVNAVPLEQRLKCLRETIVFSKRSDPCGQGGRRDVRRGARRGGATRRLELSTSRLTALP